MQLPAQLPEQPTIQKTTEVGQEAKPKLMSWEELNAKASKPDPVFAQQYIQAGDKFQSVPNKLTDTFNGFHNAPFDLAHGLVSIPVGAYNLTQAPEDRVALPPFSPFDAPKTGWGKTANMIVQFAIPYGVAGKGMKALNILQGGGSSLISKVSTTAARGLIEGSAAEFAIDHESDKRISESILDHMAEDPQAARKIASLTAPTILEDKLHAVVDNAPMNMIPDAAFTLIGGFIKKFKTASKATAVVAKGAEEVKPTVAPEVTPKNSVPKASWSKPTEDQVAAYVDRFGEPLDSNSVPLYDRMTKAAKKTGVDLSKYQDLEDDVLLEASRYMENVSKGIDAPDVPSILGEYQRKYPNVDSKALWDGLINSLKPQVKAIQSRNKALSEIVKPVKSPSVSSAVKEEAALVTK